MSVKANMHGLLRLALGVTALSAAVVTVVPLVVSAERAEVIVASGLVCLCAGGVAMIPLVLAVTAFPTYVVHAGMATVALRLLITLGAGMAYLMWERPPRQAYMTAMVGWYLVLLAVETGLTAYLTRGAWRSPRVNTN